VRLDARGIRDDAITSQRARHLLEAQSICFIGCV